MPMGSNPRSPAEVRALLEPIDWNFRGEAAAPGMLGVHWYPSKFPLPLARTLVSALATPGLPVLDPFVGCGTTLVAAARLGHSAIGIDLNPVATLISRAVTSSIVESELKASLGSIMRTVDREAGELEFEEANAVDATLELAKWYHPRTLGELSSLWSSIRALPLGPSRTVLEMCFSATLRSVCSQREHWGWICDNVHPRELSYRDAIGVFLQRTEAALAALSLDSNVSGPLVCVLEGDATAALSELADDSVGLVVTSPPYDGVTDYVRSQRLSLPWFGLSVDELRTRELGARYKRFRRSALEEYRVGLADVFSGVRRVLAPSAYLGLVVGESRRRPGRLSAFFGVLEELGFETVYRSERWLPVQRSLSSRSSREEVVVLQNV